MTSLNLADYPVIEMTDNYIRNGILEATTDLLENEEFTLALDEAQGEVMMDNSKVTYIVIKVVHEEI